MTPLTFAAVILAAAMHAGWNALVKGSDDEVLGMALIAAAVLIARPRDTIAVVRRRWVTGLVGGVATLGAYILVLWAMMRAPIPVVAALRETSILFGMVISALVLHEQVSRARLLQACAITVGAIILRLA